MQEPSSSSNDPSQPPPIRKRRNEEAVPVERSSPPPIPPPIKPSAGRNTFPPPVPNTINPVAEGNPSTREAIQAKIGKGTIESLGTRAGVDAGAFEWMIPVRNMVLQHGGDSINGGYLAKEGNHSLHYFRNQSPEGFRHEKFSSSQIRPSIRMDGDIFILEAHISGSSVLKTAEIYLDIKLLAEAFGPWMKYWWNVIADSLDVKADTLLLVKTKVLSPANNTFGISPNCPIGFTFLGRNEDEQFVITGITGLDDIPETRQWFGNDSTVETEYLINGIPHVAQITLSDSQNIDGGLSRFHQFFSENKRSKLIPSVALERTGVFSTPKGKPVVVQKDHSTILTPYSDEKKIYTKLYPLEDTSIFMSALGDFLQIKIDLEAGLELFESIPLYDGLCEYDSDSRWTFLLNPDNNLNPVLVIVHSDSMEIGTSTTIPFTDGKDIEVHPLKNGMASIRISWNQEGKPITESYVAPETLAYIFWGEWDAGVTQHKLQEADIANLYSQFNEAKQNNLLLVLFGDILLLNHQLDQEMPMVELIGRLGDIGVNEFSKDKRLHELTISKVVLLATNLAEIKQRLEVLSVMAPYYWSKQEEDWLLSVFGHKIAAKLSKDERKRIVPSIRRHFRGIQSDLLRSLSQIEAACRPLESIIAREEVRKNTPFLKKHSGNLAKGVLGGAALFIPGGQGMAVRMLGGVAVGGVASEIQKYFTKNAEAASQIQTVAKTVFPWWEVYMTTLPVMIFEATEFISQENTLTMKRDRQILEKLPKENRDILLNRLGGQLRMRILDERRNRFGEIFSGSGIRLQHILKDIQETTETGMRNQVDNFIQGLITSDNKTTGK